MTASGVGAPQVKALVELREPGLLASGWSVERAAAVDAFCLADGRGRHEELRAAPLGRIHSQPKPLPSELPGGDLEQRLKDMLLESELRMEQSDLAARLRRIVSDSERRAEATAATIRSRRREELRASAAKPLVRSSAVVRQARQTLAALRVELARVEDAQR